VTGIMDKRWSNNNVSNNLNQIQEQWASYARFSEPGGGGDQPGGVVRCLHAATRSELSREKK